MDDKQFMTSNMPAKRTRSSNRHRPTVVSLFTGAGGLDIGLETAGFETIASVEIDPHCRATIRHNRPSWNPVEMHGGDITLFTPAQLKALNSNRGQDVGLVIGGAPCQPFSQIGRGEGAASETGQLFRHFMRAVENLEPRGFVFENVASITQAKHSEVVEYLKAEGKRLGYTVHVVVLDAADYGVPQHRRRMFALGCRGPLPPTDPKRTHASPETARNTKLPAWLTVARAFKNLKERRLNRSDNLCMTVSPLMLKRYKYIPRGSRDNFKLLPMKLRPPCWRTGKHQGSDTFGRLLLTEPSVTIRTSGYHPMKGRYIHPVKHRGLNTAELARLQGFPDKWEFCSASGKPTLSSVARQIGNAVPPPLAAAIGREMMRCSNRS